MRKHKVLDKPFRENGRWWSQRWLYEKLVEVEVPNDLILKSLLSTGKINEAATLIMKIFTDVASGKPPMTIARMRITRAEILKEDYIWRGAWMPVQELFTPVQPSSISIYG